MQTIPVQSHYGTIETNGLVDGNAYHQANWANEHPVYKGVGVHWDHKGLKVTRLRLLSDPYCPFWDVSYCDGQLDGHYVRVILPFSQLIRRKDKPLAAQIIAYAKQDGVYAKGLGILDCVSKLI